VLTLVPERRRGRFPFRGKKKEPVSGKSYSNDSLGVIISGTP